MSEFLSICSSQIVRSLLTWIPILVGSVILLGIAIFALCRSRFRRLSSASGAPASRARVWTAGVLLIGSQAVLLPVVALILAMGFSLERGAANMIESDSPRVLDWGMRTGTHAMEEKLSINDSTTVVDLGRLAPVLRKVAPTGASTVCGPVRPASWRPFCAPPLSISSTSWSASWGSWTRSASS